MTLSARAYENGDHACIIWFPDDGQPIPDCRGFAIQRQKAGAKGKRLSSSCRTSLVFPMMRSHPRRAKNGSGRFKDIFGGITL
jgi:hypothetical protein